MTTYSIGEIARIVGLPTKTIRFYEEAGVLTTPTRQENGYRVYNDNILEELKMLKYARDLGLPLTEIKKLLKGCDNGDCAHSKEYITGLIDDYSEVLRKRIREMKILKTKLRELKYQVVNECKTGEPLCCNILTQLTKGGGKT